MVRLARTISDSGYYHVVLRGNGKQLIFEDDVDRHAFIDAAAERFEKKDIIVIAWCLMDNHIHMLLRDKKERMSEAMHALTTKYAQYFNRRSGHAGHVFQGRFASYPINDDPYLLEAVRYIHNNPVKAGVSPAAEYWWSSYHEYIGKPQLVDTSIVLDMLGGVDAFVAFQATDADGCYRFAGGHRIADGEIGDVASVVLSVSFGCTADQVKALPKTQRNESLIALRNAGLSMRQIERLTGIGSKTIARATASKLPKMS